LKNSIYKENWDDTKKRFDAFWNMDMLDRCCVAVTSLRKEPIPSERGYMVPKNLREKWLDMQLLHNNFEFVNTRTRFAGEALPNFFLNFGPGVLAAYCGSDYTLQDQTVWFGADHLIKEWRTRPKIALRDDAELYTLTRDTIEYFTEHAHRNYLLSMTDIGGAYDVLASLRGTENLLFDLMDAPEEVVKAVDEVQEAFFTAFTRLHDMLRDRQDGYTCWVQNLWSDKKWNVSQNDFASMISPDMFERYVAPAVLKESAWLDRCVFHLDGPGMIRHLDCLLAMDSIHAIQWQPTDYFSEDEGVSSEIWVPMFKKIQDSGKGLVLIFVKPQHVERLLKNLSPKGLFISTSCVTEDEADDLLKSVNKWSFTKSTW
jgi:hypothetical protein